MSAEIPTTVNQDQALTGVRERPAGDLWRRFARSRPALISLVWLVLVLLVALFAGLIAPYPPFEGGPDARLPPGSGNHLLGTNHLGQDVFSQLVHGARVSLLVGFSVALAATVIGVLVGAVAGFFGGVVDSVLMRISEFFQTLPRLVLALVIVALFGSGLFGMIVVLSLLSWPQTARVVRSGVQSVRQSAYVDAARVAGMPAGTVILREVLPNVMSSVVVIASLDVAAAILTEASLSFFGLGDPNFVSWGGMLFQAQAYLRTAWWMAVFPGLAIALVVLALNLVGDGLNDALNPRLKER
ncbi:peptide ABC transporter permease [Enemella evansiae]|uniref:ABC transporter permease n=1 Tax=Enemella evansiae TaxID=2016499 RepID=UPI000B96EF4E|nr:ABC transporter permease [Enemella evansiae]OYN98154.1 peptide ABC transporter permease [Enemella evansiae]